MYSFRIPEAGYSASLSRPGILTNAVLPSSACCSRRTQRCGTGCNSSRFGLESIAQKLRAREGWRGVPGIRGRPWQVRCVIMGVARGEIIGMEQAPVCRFRLVRFTLFAVVDGGKTTWGSRPSVVISVMGNEDRLSVAALHCGLAVLRGAHLEQIVLCEVILDARTCQMLLAIL